MLRISGASSAHDQYIYYADGDFTGFIFASSVDEAINGMKKKGVTGDVTCSLMG